MKYNVLNSAFLLLFLIAFNCHSFAQQDNLSDKECLEVIGVATDQHGIDIPGAQVTLYRQNEALEWQEVSTVGYHDHNFRFVLYADQYYTIEISCPGFVTRSIGISTKIPSDVSLEPLFRYEFEVGLFPDKKIADDYYLDFPVALIHYDEKSGVFNYSTTYTKHIKDKIRSTYGTVSGVTVRSK